MSYYEVIKELVKANLEDYEFLSKINSFCSEVDSLISSDVSVTKKVEAILDIISAKDLLPVISLKYGSELEAVVRDRLDINYFITMTDDKELLEALLERVDPYENLDESILNFVKASKLDLAKIIVDKVKQINDLSIISFLFGNPDLQIRVFSKLPSYIKDICTSKNSQQFLRNVKRNSKLLDERQKLAIIFMAKPEVKYLAFEVFLKDGTITDNLIVWTIANFPDLYDVVVNYGRATFSIIKCAYDIQLKSGADQTLCELYTRTRVVPDLDKLIKREFLITIKRLVEDHPDLLYETKLKCVSNLNILKICLEIDHEVPRQLLIEAISYSKECTELLLEYYQKEHEVIDSEIMSRILDKYKSIDIFKKYLRSPSQINDTIIISLIRNFDSILDDVSLFLYETLSEEDETKKIRQL